jgi:hypothetical protein
VNAQQILNEPHRQWAIRPADERFETLAAMHEAAMRERSRMRGEKVQLREVGVEADDKGVIITTPLIGAARPTNWAFGQLCERAGAPAAYLRQLPPPLVADCLNENIRQREDVKMKAMALAPVAPESDALLPFPMAACFTGPDYGRIFDADIIEQLIRFTNLAEQRGQKWFNPPDWSNRPSGLFKGDRNMFAFLITGGSIVNAGRTARGQDDILHRGFYVANSQVRERLFVLAYFLMRAVCGNLMIFGGEDVHVIKLRHTKFAPQRFADEAIPALSSYITASTKNTEATIRVAQQFMLPEDTKELQEFALTHNLTRVELAEGQRTALREEGDCRTLWQLVNGLTAYARDFEYADARLDLSTRASKLLDLAA